MHTMGTGEEIRMMSSVIVQLTSSTTCGVGEEPETAAQRSQGVEMSRIEIGL